jgi:hypothetical protein
VSDSIWGKLLDIQAHLKVEKGQYNNFGRYKYRSKEDILEAAKPLCHERGLVLICTDSVELIGTRFYIKATASIIDAETGQRVDACGYAREDELKKGMDGSQITGTAASYAGKRALGNLFSLDDTKDADSIEEPQGNVLDQAWLAKQVSHLVSLGYNEPDVRAYLTQVWEANGADAARQAAQSMAAQVEG